MGSTEMNLAKELQKEFGTLTEFEALNIACRIRNNDVLELGFGVDGYSVSSPPSHIEAIGMALGYERGSGSTLKTGLEFVASSLDGVASAIRDTNS
jgi:hypothetical protein